MLIFHHIVRHDILLYRGADHLQELVVKPVRMLHFEAVGIEQLANALVHQRIVDGLVSRLIPRARDILQRSFLVKLLHDYVQGTPYLPVVALPECVQLIVIGPSFGVDLRLLVLPKNASHGPLTVNKSAILNA